MALAGDVAPTRRRALRVFLIASVAATEFVFGAQTAHAAGAAPGFATGAASNGAISVTIDDGRLTLSAPGARLDRVLLTIGAEAGFKVIIKGDLGTLSPYTTMTRVPLARALRRLFVGTSMVIVYEPLRDGGAERIAEVRFYARPPRAPDAGPRRAPSRRGPRRQRGPKPRAAVPGPVGPTGRPPVGRPVTGAAHPAPGDPAPGERRPFGGSGTAAPDRTGRASGQIAVTQADRPGTLSFGPYFTALFWSFLTQGPSVRPCVTGAAQPALGDRRHFDESGAAHARRRDGPKDI